MQKIFLAIAMAFLLSACQPPLYYYQCGQLCVACVAGKCEYTAIAINTSSRQYQMISVHPGQLKSVAVCSGDIVHLFAFWGSDIGPGYFLIPTRAPINSTIQVSGTISHPYFSVLPNTCFYRYPPAKRDNP